MKSWMRIGLALIRGFLVGFVISLANGVDFASALQRGLIFALIVGAIVAILSWGMDIAVEKGYPGWLGFILVLFLNVIGLIILAVVPVNTLAIHKPASK